jgi:hypothetical protein
MWAGQCPQAPGSCLMQHSLCPVPCACGAPGSCPQVSKASFPPVSAWTWGQCTQIHGPYIMQHPLCHVPKHVWHISVKGHRRSAVYRPRWFLAWTWGQCPQAPGSCIMQHTLCHMPKRVWYISAWMRRPFPQAPGSCMMQHPWCHVQCAMCVWRTWVKEHRRSAVYRLPTRRLDDLKRQLVKYEAVCEHRFGVPQPLQESKQFLCQCRSR